MPTFEQILTDFTGHGAFWTFTEVPETCPLCHHHIAPRHLSAHSTSAADTTADFVFQCPRPECRRVFVARYRLGPEGHFELLSLISRPVRKERSPAEIRALSPCFVQLYDQAQEAQASGLRHLAGIGFHRALETIVRDFAIHEDPARADEIREMPLRRCIGRYVRDANVSTYAARLKWLDDEKDYLRQGDELDLEELRLLTRLVINSLENVLLARSLFLAVSL